MPSRAVAAGLDSQRSASPSSDSPNLKLLVGNNRYQTIEFISFFNLSNSNVVIAGDLVGSANRKWFASTSICVADVDVYIGLVI